MGGAAKHLMQLHHDHELAMFEIQEIFSQAARGEIKFYEKLDGMNIVFTWNDGLRYARNEGDKSKGGMDRNALAEKFRGRDKVEKAFLESYEFLFNVLENIEHKEQIFNAGLRWFSAEILGPINPNIIHYDRKSIVIHRTQLDSSDELFESFLLAFLHNLEKIPQTTDGWRISGPAEVQARKMSKKELAQFNNRLNELVRSMTGYWMRCTVQDFTWSAVNNICKEKDLKSACALYVTDRIVGKENCKDLRTLKKEFPHQARVIDELVKDDWNVFKSAQEPLNKLVNDFATSLLKGVKSSQIVNNEAEVQRLRKVTSEKIDELSKSDNPKVIQFLDEQLFQLVSVKNIDTPVEGVVFDYKGKTYKFTGSFASANRILGYGRYPH